MESAYVLMLITFGAGVVSGAATRSNWIAIGLPIMIPLVAFVSHVKGPGLAEGLLFVSPFLVAGAILYGGISFAGVQFGRWLRNTRSGGSPESKDGEI